MTPVSTMRIGLESWKHSKNHSKQMHTGGWEIVRKHVCYIDKHQLLVLESGRDGQLEGSGRELW